MSDEWREHSYLEEHYQNAERSTSSIAKEWGVYPNTVRRELIKQGFEIRNKSQAQKINIKKNGAPMEGKTRTKEEKDRISAGLQRFWDGLEDDEAQAFKDYRAKVAKEKWASLTEDEKQNSIRKMHNASRNKMYVGSKNENLVAKFIEEEGHIIDQRSNEYTPGRRFEIDIAIPKERIAIEWDGATHFDPIYGEEHLAKVQEKDKRKDRVLIAAGWTVIRCRDHSTASTQAFCRRAVNQVLDIISNGERGVVHIVEAH
jgi:very-short-patch-repair endonuclease